VCAVVVCLLDACLRVVCVWFVFAHSHVCCFCDGLFISFAMDFSVRTPGGKLVYHYKKKKGKGPRCGDCGTKLRGVRPSVLCLVNYTLLTSVCIRSLPLDPKNT